MVRTHIGIAALAAVASLAATTARAADFSPPPPIEVHESSGWYLRGFVGVGLMHSDPVEYIINPLNTNNFAIEQSSISDNAFIGGGVGYEVNNWLRFDATAEYRTKARVSAFGSYTFGGGTFGDSYDGYIKSLVFLGNAFVDLGTWDCFTPFLGAGVGGTYNTLADFTDIGIGTSGRGIGRDTSEWHLAWALYAGVAYNVTKSFKVDFTYRYLNLGSITDTVDCIGGCNPDSYKFGNLYSHDFMIGMRWTCCEAPAADRYVYAPPPPPPPPPLHSKG
jgi:opacity protein-like surface antigen